ncbi:hypothetical protein MSKU15_1265 [Komagataeibacter diospyri]|uniref:hypothetical protein n=1 Tax=Komagataeibacter diospyri TaxID=1932662 RepID=UPI00113F354A|nr:hypothetical protein [Komagataeibacter diospyri]GCE89664.1 hypothetical protein MSKU15_1265 [Komagataeibacter diospyri]
MKSQLPTLSRGDIVLRGNRHGIVVTLTKRRLLVVPLEWNPFPRHRADVGIGTLTSQVMFHDAIARCGDRQWVSREAQRFAGRVPPAVVMTIVNAIRREEIARQTERLPAGLVKSTLAFGPMMGSRGRRVGAPSLG